MGYPLPDEVAFKGPFAPMRFEATVEECIVSQGEIPKELSGGFYRTGPTWKRPTRQGTNPLLSMDGMVQGLVFDNGRVDFRNRWIRTPKYVLEEGRQHGVFEWLDSGFGDWRDFAYGDVKRDALTCGVPQGTNNINVFPFAGEIVALSEQGARRSPWTRSRSRPKGSSRGPRSSAPGSTSPPPSATPTSPLTRSGITRRARCTAGTTGTSHPT